MLRWFFANEREECVPPPSDADLSQQTDEKEETEPGMKRIYADWPFCVRVKKPLQGNEFVAISGNCDELGNWEPSRVVLLQRSTCECLGHCACRKFEATISIPRHQDVEYRYCVVAHDPLMQETIIRYWEVHLKPRVIRTCQNMLMKCERFGYQQPPNAEYKVDRGWATSETYIHFKIFNAPFAWQQQRPRLLYVHLQPMWQSEPVDCSEKLVETLRFTAYPPILKKQSMLNVQSMQLAYAEVANLRYSSKLHFQTQYGVRCGPADLQLFHCSISRPECTLYRLDLYTYAQKAAADEPPYPFGYGFIQPEQLQRSEGYVKVAITCASTHRPLIEMCLKYLIIKPFAAYKCSLNHSYERHWRSSHLALDIAHRGAGMSYMLGTDLHRENTLFSFRQAALHFADFIEFDVQLTKDAQVVVYHDYVLKFSGGTPAALAKYQPQHDVLVFPHEQFNRLKLLALGGNRRGPHIVVPIDAINYEDLRLAHALRFTSSAGCAPNCDDFLASQMPFPLLLDLFDMEKSLLHEKLGFNIELKWPQQDSNHRWQEDSFKPRFDRNLYVDTVLEIVFLHAGRRRIIFSSFDADICIMIRLKQNIYPVLLLTRNPERSSQFLDPRVNSLEHAANVGHIFEFLGLCLNTSSILLEPIIMGVLYDLRLQTVTWGSANTDGHVRDKLKRYGVMGVCYDRIDQLDQRGEELEGTICLIDSPATRKYFRKLEAEERQQKCVTIG
ncbi:CG3942 [Drosophila busckii]|uniref:CG3942 n=1 Tax=Drosophila busckii TaxID=30019 RepID=A0A0M4E0E5_DROBS|nr:glycerophosphocholine phosphodiesterase GPCPD1 [Drosophila busckii]ALC38566.1 CG3942 [Drosophila busckii]